MPLPPRMLSHGRWCLPASSLQRALLPAVSALSRPRRLGLRGKRSSSVVSLRGKRMEASWPLNCRQRKLLLAPGALDSNADSITRGFVKKRNIVEHVFLMKAKSDISEEEETDMLDYLYTSQYHMRGILAISLGRIADSNVDGFTHAVFMRFQKKEDLVKFYVDYESEVEDDILPIFRRGEEFNYGAEFVLLFSFTEDALHGAVKDALTTFQALIDKFDSLIIQATHGSNFNHRDSEYTHSAVIRFPSREALEIFRGCSEYKDTWRWKFQPIIKKALAVHFTVDPVGTELM